MKYFTELIILNCAYCNQIFGALVGETTEEKHSEDSQKIKDWLMRNPLMPVCDRCRQKKGIEK